MTVLPTSAAATHALLPVVGRETQVPLVQGGQTRGVNLDYAASAPALQAVADHLAQLLPYYSSVHRGAGYLSRVCTSAYEQARETVAVFVKAGADDVVVFTRNTTDALSLLASCVPGEVVLLDVEHHANLLPWQRRGDRIVHAAPTVRETVDLLEAELTRRPAALLTVTGASNVTGECLPLPALARIAHRHGARLAVDGAQLVPHRGFDLAGSGADYVAFSGHKIYAPYGAGVLVGRRDWLDAAPAYLAGGGAVREVSTERTEWASSPARHEGGTPNVLGAVALAAACAVLDALPADAVRHHETALLQRLALGLAALGIEPLRCWDDADDTVGLVSFVVPGHDAGAVAAFLSAEHGIGVRDGRFCAHPLLRALGVDAAVRVSFGVGSSGDDVDRLLAALGVLIEKGPSWDYVREPSGWSPLPETRHLPPVLAGRSLVSAGSACDNG